MRLVIWPQPSADEAAAIHSAVAQRVARTTAGGRRLRYGDVARARDAAQQRSSSEDGQVSPDAVADLTWADAARLESLNDGV